MRLVYGGGSGVAGCPVAVLAGMSVSTTIVKTNLTAE